MLLSVAKCPIDSAGYFEHVTVYLYAPELFIGVVMKYFLFFLTLGCIDDPEKTTVADSATETEVTTEDSSVEIEYLIDFTWNDEEILGESIQLANSRRFLHEGSGVFSVVNEMNRPASLSVEAFPDWLQPVSWPVEIPPAQTVALTFTVDNTIDVGEYSDDLILLIDQTETHSFSLQAIVEPYIQLQLQDLPDVDSAVEVAFADQQWIGGAVAVVENQDIIYLRGLGVADLLTQTPIDPSVHRFRWASVAKGIAGVLSTQLIQEGALDLDESISEYFTSYVVPDVYLPSSSTDPDTAVSIPSDSKMISMRQLLSHTSCIQHYSNGSVDPVPPNDEIQNPAINTGMEWALAYWTDAPLICVPGAAYNYSTFAYNLAGVVLEHILMDGYSSLVMNRVSSIIDASTLLPDYHWAPEPDRVRGYTRQNGNVVPVTDTDVSWKLAAGGFNSTPEDLARYCAGLMGNELVSDQQKDDYLWAPQPNAGDYALGFNTQGNLVYHDGSQQSAETALLIDRSSNQCVVVMVSSRWGNPWDLLNAARAALSANE